MGSRMAKQRSGAFAVVSALAAAVALALASGAGATTPARTTAPDLHNGPAHWWKPATKGQPARWGTWGQPARWRPASSLSLLAVDNLQNPGNNEIMPQTNTHLIFWLPTGFHFSSTVGDANYESQMIKYFQDVGGSQILNTATQYNGRNGYATDVSNFIDSVVDTTAYPHTGADVANSITQTDLLNEVYSNITAKSWPLGLNDMYFIFLPDNVVDCSDDHTSCNTNAYCAYHTYGYVGSDDPDHSFIWSDIPDNRSIYSAGGCGDSNVTGDRSADTTLSSVEHEHLEAVTDPRLNAWKDSTGNAGENGDKCNRNMGVANGHPTWANNFLGAGAGDLFRIQREWSNAVSGCAASYTTTGSHVESPAPTGGDVTLTVTEASIPGNTSDTLHYTATFHNPSNQDDAFSITVSNGFSAGVTGTASVNVGDLAPHQSKTVFFTAHPSVPLAAGSTITATSTFNFDDSTGTAQPAIARTATTTVVNAPPTVNPLTDQSVDYHDPLSYSVSGSDTDLGDHLLITLAGLPAGLSYVDNGDRTATISGSPTAVPGDYTVNVTVNDQHNTPVSATFVIHVRKEQTTTTFVGPLVILAGSSGATLSGTLLEDGTTPPVPSGQTLTLSVGTQSCAATVLPSGDASCTLSSVTVPLGPTPVAASFAGDAYYLPSSDTGKTAIVFAFPTTGVFALGDSTVAAAGPTTTLTFWSSNWWLLNTLSGGPAPLAFKGFALNVLGLPTSSPPASCGGTFATSGGNSPPPAAFPPSYMGAVVTGNVTKTGNTISGSFSHIVVLKTDPGFTTSPGHNGTGTIVATYC
jgi:hypothetical protein